MTDTPTPAAGYTELDLNLRTDALFDGDPWAAWEALQRRHRVIRTTNAPDPVWILTRYEDVHDAMQDTGLFSNSCVAAWDRRGRHRWIPEELDPPEHTRFRQFLNPFFSPSRVADLEPRMRRWCIDLIEGFARDGGCEFVAQFGRRFPTVLFMEVMGLPTGDADQFLDWVTRMMHSGADDAADRVVAYEDLMEYLGGLLDARRVEPEDDVITALVGAEIDGRPLTPGELRETCLLLYMAGLDTVTGELAAMFHHLATHPDDRQGILDDPSLVPTAVDEFLRLFGLVVTGRVVTRDVDFRGCPMHAGDRVLLPTPATGRDRETFPDAGLADLSRAPNRHMAFGVGPHRCLGRHLARVELAVALEEWHARIPHYRIPDPAMVQTHGREILGYARLPITWS